VNGSDNRYKAKTPVIVNEEDEVKWGEATRQFL